MLASLSNFISIYLLIAESAINKYIDMKLDNKANIKDYFDLNNKHLISIINKVEEC